MTMAGKRNASRKKGGGIDSGSWLITFSDLVTLLLTFFVLILSMSTLDVGIIGDAFTIFTEKVGFLTSPGAGKMEDRFSLLKKILREPPWEVIEKQDRIKDLLFPHHVLTPELSRSTLDENLEILATPEGVALVLSEGILFESGGSNLTPAAEVVLKQIGMLIPAITAPTVVSGHTDTIPGRTMDNMELSAERAMAVLSHLLAQGVDPHILAAAGYGPLRPLAANDTPEGRARNRRVEILLENAPYARTYL